MTTLRDAAQMALEALEETEALLSSMDVMHLLIYGEVHEAITTLRAALDEPTCQESRQVEPMHPEIRKLWEDYFDKYFAAISQRKPQNAHDKMYSEVDLADAYQKGWDEAMLRRAIERAHGIGGEK